MPKKTHSEILTKLYNDQLELILSQKAYIRTMKRLDQDKVMEVKIDHQTMQAKKITVKEVLEKAEEKLELYETWLEEIEKLLKEHAETN